MSQEHTCKACNIEFIPLDKIYCDSCTKESLEDCDHEYESYGSERLDRSSIVVFYQCVKCGVEMEDILDEPIRTDDIDE